VARRGTWRSSATQRRAAGPSGTGCGAGGAVRGMPGAFVSSSPRTGNRMRRVGRTRALLLSDDA
jgi:hypothetical protein